MRITKINFRVPRPVQYRRNRNKHSSSRYVLPSAIGKYDAIEVARKIAPYTVMTCEYEDDPETGKFSRCWIVYPLKVRNGKITKTVETVYKSNTRFIDRDVIITTPTSQLVPCYACKDIFNKGILNCRLFTSPCISGINIKGFDNAKEGDGTVTKLKVSGSNSG